MQYSLLSNFLCFANSTLCSETNFYSASIREGFSHISGGDKGRGAFFLLWEFMWDHYLT